MKVTKAAKVHLTLREDQAWSLLSILEQANTVPGTEAHRVNISLSDLLQGTLED